MNQKLQEIVQAAYAGQFIRIHGYVNQYGEVSDYLVHADANYGSVHTRSEKELQVIRGDVSRVWDVTRFVWIDATGKEHTREAKGRTKVKRHQVVPNDEVGVPELKEAYEKVLKSITAPREITNDFTGSNSAYELDGEAYLRNVLVERKDVIREGEYPESCQSLVSALVDLIKRELPISKYRTFKLGATTCQSLSASGEIFTF